MFPSVSNTITKQSFPFSIKLFFFSRKKRKDDTKSMLRCPLWKIKVTLKKIVENIRFKNVLTVRFAEKEFILKSL
jgi:hypothetical protein